MIERIPIRGFDFHCHVDLHPDPPRLIEACERDQIVTLAVTTTPKAWPKNAEWASASPYVYAAVGLHPELVAERFSEIDLLEVCIEQSRLIGEVGLDGSPRHRGSWSEQLKVFVRVLEAAGAIGGRVVSIHSRRASAEVIKCLQEHSEPGRLLPILHWFSGSPSEARRAADLGAYFSVNPRSLDHPLGMALTRVLPERCLLTETDAPFASRNHSSVGAPGAVLATVERLAAVRELPLETMRSRLAENAARVFSFAGVDLPSVE